MRNISTSNRKPSAAGSGVRTEALWVTCRPPYPLCHSGYPSGSSSLHNDNVVKAQTANPRTPFPDRQSAHILSQYLSCHCSNPSFPPSQPSLKAPSNPHCSLRRLECHSAGSGCAFCADKTEYKNQSRGVELSNIVPTGGYSRPAAGRRFKRGLMCSQGCKQVTRYQGVL